MRVPFSLPPRPVHRVAPEREARLEKVARRAIGIGAANFGLVAVLTRIYLDSSTLSDVVAVGFAGLAVASAVAWFTTRFWVRGVGARIFGVFADVGTLCVLLTIGPSSDAVLGCVLFAVTGVFFMFYLSRRWLLTHVAFAGSVTVAFSVHAVVEGAGVWEMVVRADVVLAAVVGTATTTHLAWTTMRRRARMAGTDALTGVRNVRGMWHDAVPMLVEADALGDAVVVAVADIDGFKSVNDAHGHDVGDQVLVEVAHRLADHVGSAGFVARSGGEEFTAVIAGPIDQVRSVVASLPTTVDGGDTHPTVTMSVGAVIANPLLEVSGPDAAREAHRQADRIMYEVKRSGGAGVGLHF